MLKKIATAAKIATTLSDARHRRFWMQRNVTSLARRQAMASSISAQLPRLDGPLPPEAAARAALVERDGFAMATDLVPASWVGEMRDYFVGQPCADPYRPKLGTFVGPQNAPPGTHVAYFGAQSVVNSPRALEIVNLPGIVQTVGAVLGGKPTISYMAALWTIPAHDGMAQHAEKFHRDVDDIDFIKFFMYMTDVDEESGPHVYIKGSHNKDRLTRIRRYEDDEVYDSFGRENEVRFTGPAGTSILEKTYGFHRGYPARSTPRLMFAVLYSLRETIYGPKSPVIDPRSRGLAIDPFINRIYCRAG